MHLLNMYNYSWTASIEKLYVGVMNDGGRTCTSRLLILSTNNGFKPLPFWTIISDDTGSKGFATKLDKSKKNPKIKESII